MKIIKSGNNFGRSNGDFIIIYFTYIYYSTKYYLNKVQSYWIFISNIIEFSFLIFKTLSRQRYRSYICETDKDNTTRVVDTRQVFLPANECSHKKNTGLLDQEGFRDRNTGRETNEFGFNETGVARSVSEQLQNFYSVTYRMVVRKHKSFRSLLRLELQQFNMLRVTVRLCYQTFLYIILAPVIYCPHWQLQIYISTQ